MQIKSSKRLEQLFVRGCAEVQKRGTEPLTPDKIWLTVLSQGDCHATHILGKLLKQWELQQVRTWTESELARAPRPITPAPETPSQKGAVQAMSIQGDGAQAASAPETSLQVSPEQEVARLRAELAVRLQTTCHLPGMRPTEVFNTGHLLLAVLVDKNLIASRVLEQYRVTPEKVIEYVVQLPAEEDFYDDLRALERLSNLQIEIRNMEQEAPCTNESQNEGREAAPEEESTREPRAKRAPRAMAVLDKHAVNLTAAAAAGEIDPVVGREAEIERLIQILGRRKKNNPILVGEAGVGKSAIVEGLALRIAAREVPHALRDKRVYSLDIASLVAGTKYRGEFEERIKELLRELSRNGHVILFIDEIHTIAGAGSTQGSLDTANILKPALARGELQCIGATTLDEYREHIESDPALERRFQKIIVEPATKAQTLEILRNIRTYYERHHRVRYTDEALAACVELTGRYITDRHFPDKAIDVLDEAGSKAHIFHAKEPETIGELENQIRSTVNEKRQAIQRMEYERAAGIRLREVALRGRLAENRSDWERELSENPVEVHAEHIEQVITSMTGIPVERVSQGEQARLKGMEAFLGSIVVGQGDAVSKVTRSIQRSRAGLKDPNKPIGVFMFVGPTGVGKTHLAKELSKWMFDRREALIRVDMSEYAEKHNVSRLIGSPPGYVGYNEGGQLTEAVRRQPYAVVLFDEIEKAHPDVFNVMLQIFDDGQLTDGLGRKVDFRNTVIIMTSNVGSRMAAQRTATVGYNTSGKPAIEQSNRESDYRRALESTFAPEFINRIDDIVVFNTLTAEDVKKIVDLELRALTERMTGLGYRIGIKSEARCLLAKQGYEPRYGVRSLKRTILEQVEEPLAGMIVGGEVAPGDKIDICYAAGRIELRRQAASSNPN